MPEIGEIKYGRELGKPKDHNRYIWESCSKCHNLRWVMIKKNPIIPSICRHCNKTHVNKLAVSKGTITNPCVGDIRPGQEMGLSYGMSYLWAECPQCHLAKWVRFRDHNNGKAVLCRKCSHGAENHANWKGGTFLDGEGYRLVRIPDNDPYASMATRKGNGLYLLEHRYVMAKHLGRILTEEEIVHHKNGIKTNNKIENLELTINGQHIKDHHKGYDDGYMKGYQDGITKAFNEQIIEELRKEVRTLLFIIQQKSGEA